MTVTDLARSAHPAPPPGPEILLEVRDLRTEFRVMDGRIAAVDGAAFRIPRGGTLGLVGESGSGKSVTALSIMRLIETPPGEISGGEVWLEGRELLGLDERAMRRVRGEEMAMIFQEPMTSLNPVLSIGDQIVEAIVAHRHLARRTAWNRAIEMLRLVGIPDARRRAVQYPHELSGGMRQRVMIGMALSCEPKLLIADEPTTALDVTIQAQIMELIAGLQAELGMALLLITHDLALVAETVSEVVVMYAGQVVESGPTDAILQRPKHPYTEALLASIPSRARRGERLNVIQGSIPNPFHLPHGCRFTPRCPYAFEPCPLLEPPLDVVEPGRSVRCWLHAPHPEVLRR